MWPAHARIEDELAEDDLLPIGDDLDVPVVRLVETGSLLGDVLSATAASHRSLAKGAKKKVIFIPPIK